MALPRRILLSLAGASLAGRAAYAAGAQQKPGPMPIIGAALPLSGDLSLIGDECLRGIQLAADSINAAGGIAGKQVNLLQADGIDGDHAAAAVNSLIATGHANVILGSGTSSLSYPGSAAAELAQIPYIELTAPADSLTTRGFKFLLRTGPTASMAGNLAAQTILHRFRNTRIGVLYNTGPTAAAIAAAAIAALQTAKVPVLLAQGYAPDVTDLYDAAGRLKRAGAKLVLHAADPTDALAFYAALGEQFWRPAAILGCGDGYLLRDTQMALGTQFDGTWAIGAPFYPAPAAAIATAYTARFGTSPRSPDSLTAYCGAKLVFDTLNAANGDPTQLLASLRKINLALGALPNGFGAAFDHNGQNTNSFVTLQQWRDGLLTSAG